MAKTGSNASGMRRYNERLVLSTIHRMKQASKTDVARATGLSAQSALRIFEKLEDDGRLIRSGKRPGKKGQPSILYRINGESGLTIGVEIGRNKIACALLDFGGRVLVYESRAEAFPDPEAALAFIQRFTEDNMRNVPQGQSEGFMGFGIAMPWFLGEWQAEAEPERTMISSWPVQDLEAFFRASLDGPVMFDNDGNAAALSELHNGAGTDISDYVYIHLGHFVGGGLVLNKEVRRGVHGNAASLASLPLSVPGQFLLDRASASQMPPDSDPSNPVMQQWLQNCKEALAFAMIGMNSLLDMEAVIIGGELPAALIESVIADVGEALKANAPRDFFQPRLIMGRNQDRAAAIGAALLPVHSSFNPNLSALFKTSGPKTA